MSFTIDAALASIITAVIVGILSVVTTLIANGHAARQQRDQWAREEKRAEREAKEAAAQREYEVRKTRKAELEEIYGNAISSLSLLILYSTNVNRLSDKYADSHAEAQKWLALVLASHYDKTSAGYTSFRNLCGYVIGAEGNPNDLNVLRNLREGLIELVSKDPRLILD